MALVRHHLVRHRHQLQKRAGQDFHHQRRERRQTAGCMCQGHHRGTRLLGHLATQVEKLVSHPGCALAVSQAAQIRLVTAVRLQRVLQLTQRCNAALPVLLVTCGGGRESSKVCQTGLCARQKAQVLRESVCPARRGFASLRDERRGQAVFATNRAASALGAVVNREVQGWRRLFLPCAPSRSASAQHASKASSLDALFALRLLSVRSMTESREALAFLDEVGPSPQNTEPSTGRR